MKLRFFTPWPRVFEGIFGRFPMFFASWANDGSWYHTDVDESGWKTVEHSVFSLEYITSSQPGDPPALRLIIWKLMLGVAFAKRP